MAGQFPAGMLSKGKAVDNGNQNAKKGAGRNLQRSVAYEFLQLFFIGKGLSHSTEKRNHFFNDLGLDSGFPADAAGIIHDASGIPERTPGKKLTEPANVRMLC